MEVPSSGFMLKAIEERRGEKRRGEGEESVVEEEVKWASIETNHPNPLSLKTLHPKLRLGFRGVHVNSSIVG
jgi:hypothetical protein